MKIISIQFSPWDKTYSFDAKDYTFQLGDKVVVKTDMGIEVGRVVSLKELVGEELDVFLENNKKIKPVLRKANLSDLQKMDEKEKHCEEGVKICNQLIKKYKLPIKLVDVRFSFDGGRITFAFIARGRIDFRDLVKDLTHHFQKSIRLQQINVREEVKFSGKVGPCGRELCCLGFLKKLGNITLEKAQSQQIVHWGPERLSGVCGRLKCCLAFEDELYKELAQKLPAIGTTIKTKLGKGRVVGWHILKQTVNVKLDNDTVIEVPI